jgi:hypothetical protein
LPEELRTRYDEALQELADVEKARPAPLPKAICLDETGAEAPKTYVLERGELSNRSHEVTPGFPVVMTTAAPAITPVQGGRSSGRRTALARWLASPDNPLTARVMVNRVWQHLLGRGIIATPSDFGLRGEAPTHPELLDWLATSFAAQPTGDQQAPPGLEQSPQLGWSVKALIKLIVTSNTYKQSSMASAATLAADPDNEWFSRMNRKRLEGEAIRDAVLAISGRLNPKMGGPGVFPPIPKEALPPKANAWPVSADPADHTRRSLYTFVRRNLQFPALEVFDAPDTNASCARREVTTSAPQALSLLNAPEMGANARALAGRLLREAPDDEARLRLAYRLALGRYPSPAELRQSREFLEAQAALLRALGVGVETVPGAGDPVHAAALADFCLALFNLNEFVYLD